MELANNTPIPAHVSVVEVAGLPQRIGVITAKSTYHFGPGYIEMNTQAPLPLLQEDQETERGIIPRDVSQQKSGVFELILLATAHAAGGQPVKQMRIALTFAGRRREMLVFGNRYWTDAGQISEPEPFVEMPLTWSRAFGGTAQVEIDKHAFVALSDPLNARGKGFDPSQLILGLKSILKPPLEYPRYENARWLPNLEDPNNQIESMDDRPEPICWSTIPLECGFRQIYAVRRGGAGVINDSSPLYHELLLCAHPDWVLGSLDPDASVRLEGMNAAGPIDFPMPRTRIFADYVVANRTGELALVPSMCVIFAEEKLLTITYRARFSLLDDPADEHSFRLRIHGDQGLGSSMV